MVSENKTLKKDQIENNRFKRNFELFNSLLQKNQQLNTYIENDRGIVFGNPEAATEIVLITNPFCGYCKSVHQQIHKLLDNYGSMIKIRVRFNIDTSDQESDLVKITASLLHIYHTRGEKTGLQAMDEIYNELTPKKWLNKWEDTSEREKYSNELNIQQKWCIDNAINFTPEVLINGKSYPKEYDREDLIFFIEDLIEYTEKKDSIAIAYHNDAILFN